MEQKEFPNYKQERMDKIEYRALYWLYGFIMFIFALLMVFVIGRSMFYANFKYYPVRGTSMQPTINPDITSTVVQDGVFVKYDSPINYEDIIIIKLPNQTSTIIKRVIAKGGDKVCIRRYAEHDNEYRVSVIRKGSFTAQVLEEDYIKSYSDWKRKEDITISYNQGEYSVQYEREFYNTFLTNSNVTIENDGCYYYTVPEDNIFYLGDNRLVSRDARANGTTPESGVVGVVKILIHDVDVAEEKGTLWWVKFKGIISYFFDQISNFFAWKY